MSSLIAIYLNDHLAGAVAGTELVKRTLGQNRGTEYEPELERLAADIEQDRQRLEEIMQALGVRQAAWKTTAAWVAEKLGRVKLNGALVAYSPLSRLEELELLTLGVQGKLQLWHSLTRWVGGEAQLDVGPLDLDELIRRASSQRRRLERHRANAAGAMLQDRRST